MTDPRQSYASARLQARYARRPGAAQWGALDASRTSAHYLDVLRAGRWLHVPEGSLATDVDARERWLRQAWREACGEVAGWHPPGWRAAFQWLDVLPDLDALERLRAGDPLPAWLQSEPRLAVLADTPPEARDTRVAATDYASLQHAWRVGEPFRTGWLERWHAAWPASDWRTRRALRELEAAVTAAGTLAVGPRREAIEAAAHRAFRRGAGTAAAGFAHLALVALQLERVRGGFARRAAMPAAGGAG